MPIYQPNIIEEKWLAFWQKHPLAKAREKAEKLYLLFAFAYPSGSGLHVGHVESKTALDILARYNRMLGKDVFFPVGWDAFGLPAENYAIKTGVPPAKTTKQAIDTFRTQIKRLAISYDWSCEIATSHPKYYRWTQWIFSQLYKKGLAYQGIGMVNWCSSCQTVLANEQVVNGVCERCGTTVIQKDLKQWYFKITNYKDELLSGLDQVDWPNSTKQQQKDWIGKSSGLQINFTLAETGALLPIWTKYWETIYGTTFVVISPEKYRELQLSKVKGVTAKISKEVEKYLEDSSKKTEEDRKIGQKDKSGVDSGLKVINPCSGEKLPLYIADYVLANVGTGVVMGVPSHDKRDFEFAQKFGLPCKQVVSYKDIQLNSQVAEAKTSSEEPGTLINSGQFDGQQSFGEDKNKMAEWLIQKSFASWKTTYKLRDWLISRQRYWGAPIPIVYDPDGKPHLVKEEHLPWLLPEDVDFRPTGESPLTRSKEFMARTEKLYGKGWRPEFDTMDTFVDSSWYYLRYPDARNDLKFADPQMLKKWLPIDFYLIGPEHIVLHLLYARFFTKFLRDEGLLNFDEPFMKMRHQGMILGPDGKKMSKSKGNVINPDEVIEKFGADTLRVYEMFMGPLEADKPWETRSVVGIYRFLSRIYNLALTAIVSSSFSRQQAQQDAQSKPAEVAQVSNLNRQLHQTIKKVTQDIPALKFNTAISALMVFVNEWEKKPDEVSRQGLVDFVKMLAPFAPFLSEEIWQELESKTSGDNQSDNLRVSVHQQLWPIFDEQMAKDEAITVIVQVNGKLRGELSLTEDLTVDEAYVLGEAKLEPSVAKWLEGKKMLRELYVKGKVVNFVVS